MTEHRGKLVLTQEARKEIPAAFDKCLQTLDKLKSLADDLATLPDVGDAFTANEDGRTLKQRTMEDGEKARVAHNQLYTVVQGSYEDLQADFATYDQVDGDSGAAIARTQNGIPGGR